MKAIRSEDQESMALGNRPLPGRIADFIRERIILGELKPGQPVTETALAARLKVSRAPVREAIRLVVEDGLIEAQPYRGATVRRMTVGDVEELYSLRARLETFAAECLLARTPAADLAPLIALCDRMEAAVEAGEQRLVTSHDEAFHTTLITLSGHDLLAACWRPIALRVRWILAGRNRRPRNRAHVAAEHRVIVAALVRRDVDAVRAMIADHLRLPAGFEPARLPEGSLSS